MQKAENSGQSTALTSGNIKKQLVLFSIPIFWSKAIRTD